jgi:HK97 family phage major capsid protein
MADRRTNSLFDPAAVPEVTADSLEAVVASAKSIDDKRKHGTALLSDAQAYLDAGSPETATRLFEEAKKLDTEVAQSLKVADAVKGYSEGRHLPQNDTPVVEGEEYNADDNKRLYSASHKPAGWIRNFPAAVQPKWVREQMGDTQKEENEIYKKAFSFWMRDRSHNGENFWRNGNPIYIRAMEEGTDAEGGYLVPEDWRDELIHDPGLPGSVIRPRTTVVSTGRDAGNFPTFGSVTWAGIAEEAAFTSAESTPTIGQVAFTIWKTGGLVRASTELLQDEAHNLPAVLSQVFNEAKGRYEDEQVIGGDGTTEIEGIRSTAAADVTMASATAIVALDVHELYWTLPAQFRTNATMYTTSSLMQQLGGIGSTSAGQTFGEDLTAAPGDTFLGRPTALFDGTGWDSATAIAANEELGALGDFRNYYLIDRVGISIKRNDSLYMGNGQVGFFAEARGDGRVGLTNAFRILKAAAS